MVARAQGRRRWRAVVALTLFVGLVGGLAIALVAGARRSSTVVDRYFATARVYTMSIVPQQWGPTREQLLDLPGVTRADPGAYVATSVVDGHGKILGGTNGQALDFAAVDPTFRVVEGALPDASDPTGVVVNPSFVHQFGLSVGDTVRLGTFGVDQADQVSVGVYEPDGPVYTMHIRAVGRTPDDIAVNDARSPGSSGYGNNTTVGIQDAFYQAHRSEFLDFGGVYNLAVRGQGGRRQVADAVAALTPAGEDPAVVLPPQTTQRSASLQTPVKVETAALGLLGLGVGLAVAIALALVLRSEQRLHDDDTPAVRALGGTAHQLGLVATVRALPLAVGGALLAGLTAMALSPRFPIGIGRQIELDPGFHVDGLVVGIGVAVVVLATLGPAYVFGRPRRARAGAPRRPRSLAGRLSALGAPTDATIAAHLAFDRGSSRRTPSRGAIAGGAVLIAIVTAIGVYVSGVDHLYTSPAAHGWEWDVAIGNTNFPMSPDTAARVGADHRVAAATAAEYGSATVDGEYAEFLVYDPRGSAPPQVIEGRLPVKADEVALGGETLRKVGAHVGSTVEVAFASSDQEQGGTGPKRRLRVVGRALAPAFGDAEVGDVGLLSFAGARRLGAPTDPQIEMVRLHTGSAAAGVAAIDRDYTEEIATDIVPARVLALHRVRGVPLVGLVAAATMALFVLAYALALSVRLRNRDLAILRALGLPVRRVRRVLTWLGVIFATGVVVIGVPVGLLLGGVVWRQVAHSIDMATTLDVSPYLWLVVPLTFALALVAAWVPGRRVARQDVSALLQPE